MSKVGDLFVVLGISTAAFASGLDKVKRLSFTNMKEIERSFQIIGRAASVAAAAWGTAAAFMVKNSIDAADNFNKLSQRTGVAVETLSGLAHAADLAGVDTESLAKGLQHLSKFMVSQGEGARDVKAKFMELAEQFSRSEDGAAKTAAALKIFGKAGAELIPLLNSGRAGIEGMWSEAERLGLVINKDTAVAAEAFNDNLTRLTAVLRGFATQVMAENIPALNALSQHIFIVASHTKATGDVTFSWAERMGIALAFVRGNTKSLIFEFEVLGELITALASRDPGKIAAAISMNEVRGELAQNILEQEIADVRATFRDFQTALTAGADLPKLDGVFDGMLDDTQKLKKHFEIVHKSTRDWKEDLDKIPRLLPFGQLDRAGIAEFFENVERANTDKLFEAAGEGWREFNANLNDSIDILAAVDHNAKNVFGSLDSMKQAATEFRSAIGQAFEDAIVNGQSLRNVFVALAQDIARLILRTFVLNRLFGFIGNLFGGIGGGGASSVLSGLPLGGGGGSVTGAGFAEGGFMPPRTWGIVGERGPELAFAGNQGATIVPMGKMGGGATTIAIDARGNSLDERRKAMRLAMYLADQISQKRDAERLDQAYRRS